MRLYRFLKAEYGLKSIREKRLRIGRLEELNDDFEMIGLALAEKAERIALREVRRQLHVGSGVLCMSKSWSSPQMWAHYADSHQGMVLGFDVPDDPERFMRVDYVEKRPSLADFGHKTLDELTADDMKRLIRIKAAGWSYEDEYRAFVSLEEGEEINGAMHYFKPFADDMKLRQVIVGSRYRGKRQELVQAVADAAVDIFMSRGSFEKFEVVRQKQESLWR